MKVSHLLPTFEKSFAEVYFVMSWVTAEVAVRTRALGMHDALGNALAIELRHLLKQKDSPA